MVFFAQKVLRKLPGAWTFVVVTDRKELDEQIYKNFAAVGAVKGAETHAGSAEELRQLLRNEGPKVGNNDDCADKVDDAVHEIAFHIGLKVANDRSS